MARRNLNLKIIRLAIGRLAESVMDARYQQSLTTFRESYTDLISVAQRFLDVNLSLLPTALGRLYPTINRQVTVTNRVKVRHFPSVPHSLRKDGNYDTTPIWANWLERSLDKDYGDPCLYVDLRFDTCGHILDFVNALYHRVKFPDHHVKKKEEKNTCEFEAAEIQLVTEFMKEYGGWVHTFFDAHLELKNVFEDAHKLAQTIEEAVGSRPAWKRIETEVPQLLPFVNAVVDERADEQSTMAVDDLIACVAEGGACD